MMSLNIKCLLTAVAFVAVSNTSVQADALHFVDERVTVTNDSSFFRKDGDFYDVFYNIEFDWDYVGSQQSVPDEQCRVFLPLPAEPRPWYGGVLMIEAPGGGSGLSADYNINKLVIPQFGLCCPMPMPNQFCEPGTKHAVIKYHVRYLSK